MFDSPLYLGNSSLALAFLLVGCCLILLWIERLKLFQEVVVGSIRGFLQLLLLGYVIEIVFGLERLVWILVMIGAMIAIGAHTVRRRAGKIRRAWLVCAAAITAGTVLSLGVAFLFGIVPSKANYLIPLGGIVVGNATRMLSVGLDRLLGEVKNRRAEIEVALALGADARAATQASRLAAMRAAINPLIDGMKIMGTVQIPGAMLGMILGGASPLEAAKLQIVVLFLILANNTATIVAAVELAYPSYFTRDFQLRPVI